MGIDPREKSTNVSPNSSEEQLKGYRVYLSDGEVVGTVSDIWVDEEDNLELIILSEDESGNTLYRLNSREVTRIDKANRSLQVQQKPDRIVGARSPIYEERLVVDRSRRKVGEVVVRKVVETRMVEVPVRREKLVVERTDGSEPPLAEVNLSEERVSGVEPTSPTARGEFLSPRAAAEVLQAIAKTHPHGCTRIRIEVEFNDAGIRDNCQEIFDRCSRARHDEPLQ